MKCSVPCHGCGSREVEAVDALPSLLHESIVGPVENYASCCSRSILARERRGEWEVGGGRWEVGGGKWDNGSG